ncbi:hypothetical protein SBF1_6960002 [Candidatus Desulfosporosinus infrequens]|uniref:Uncharacterized protein n=1 Tax=Candidatus Desulfosporosinus infrequens TaxID=2043169 RepID=A0A2U3LPB9_9FIRM|nr:hypothetical protein SBF1_6960002 [Candidatus Desulfosporosinus infrequens]
MEKEKRVDPDELLASLDKEGLGKLAIFLGAAIGYLYLIRLLRE